MRGGARPNIGKIRPRLRRTPALRPRSTVVRHSVDSDGIATRRSDGGASARDRSRAMAVRSLGDDAQDASLGVQHLCGELDASGLVTVHGTAQR